MHLAERLVANLIDNALRHNHPGGQVEITTTTREGTSVLVVSNTGPVVPPAEIDRLLQPFQRLAGERNAGDAGLGLGLSIVHAIAIAHGATLVARARTDGGLAVDVSFPAAVSPAPSPEPEGP
jgi:signal transduction histidine kinase